jgi:hypothetical protein
MRLKNFLKRFLLRKQEPPASSRIVDPAKLRCVYYYTRIPLAYPREQVLFIPQPCERCSTQAIQHANWQLELESELNALTQPHTAAQEEEKETHV